jgi:transposase-like protein
MSERKWRRRSEAQWRALIDRHESGGTSVEAFCRAESISTGSVYRWRQRLLNTPTVTEQVAPSVLDLGVGGVNGGRNRRILG